MSIQVSLPNLSVNYGAAPTIPQPVAPAATAPATTAAQPFMWSPKTQIEDNAYDAYAFSKFPLNLGGVGFWTGGSIRRSIASMFSNIPADRLQAYGVREQFMRLQGMSPDYARLLQMAYYQQVPANAMTTETMPLTWLAQFGAPGTLNDWMLRGPMIISLGALAAQTAMQMGYVPDVPGNQALESFGQQAAQIAPPVQPMMAQP
ncbi:MAG TPA: hypothetical protein V6D47_15925 [Oscillatoriaceae cyanobacterium]